MIHNNNDSLVYPISDSTEAVINRMIEGIQRLITIHPPSQGEEDRAAGGKQPTIKISLAMKRHWESEIGILREAP